MAEQEAVANVVASAVSDSTQGESLLLPLLQELLDKKCSPNIPGAPVMQRSASSQSSEESGAATIDSGTESGEELRLLAAGLAEGIEPLGPGLLAEVQNALNKLALSLQIEDNQIENERKNSLLQLVARLQANLVVPSRPPSERRSSGGRFNKQKNRQNRHTVGVSSEELEAARKLMQEVVLRDNLTADFVGYKPQVKNVTAKPYIDPKSISEPSTPNLNYKPPTNRQSSLNLEPQTDFPQMDWKPEYSVPDLDGVETDDDASTVKHSDYNTPTPINDYMPVQISTDYYPENKDMSAAQRLLNIAINDDSKAQNRFNTKKLKMKRANTIDIPKPLNYYECEEDTDDDMPTSRRSNYLALRGPIRVGSTVPTFEPKTESDKKFMAFIQKHNNNQSNISSVWSNKEPAKRSDHNWTNKFGNIKTIFEKDECGSRPTSTNINSAKQFWQTADDAVNAGKKSYNGPTISRKGTRQLQTLFEQKQQEHNNVITGTLKVESNFKPIQNNQHYKFIPQPLPVNKFDHAPMSAFKPPPKRTPSEPNTPLFLYTPKIPEFPEPKPSCTPWIKENKSEHRVLSIAAAKFENPSREMSPQPTTRKFSKDKVYIPPAIQNTDLAAPFMVKNVPTKQTVRKMSGEYDHNCNNLEPKKADRQIQTVRQNVQKFSAFDRPKQNYLQHKEPQRQSYQYENTPKQNHQSDKNRQYQFENNRHTPEMVYRYKEPQNQYEDMPKQNYHNNKNCQLMPEKAYQYKEPKKGYQYEDVTPDNKYQYKEPERQSYPNDKNRQKDRELTPEKVYQYKEPEKGGYQYEDVTNQNYQYEKNRSKDQYQYKEPEKQSYHNDGNRQKDRQLTPEKAPGKYQYENTPNNKYQYKEPERQSYQFENIPQSDQTNKNGRKDRQLTPEEVYLQELQYLDDNQYFSDSYHPDSHKPTKPNPFFDFPSSESTSRSASTAATPDNLDEPPVVTPLTEYKAVSKVMTGPVTQQAVTVSQNTPKKREEHDFAARNLTGLLKISMEDGVREKSPNAQQDLETNLKHKEKKVEPKQVLEVGTNYTKPVPDYSRPTKQVPEIGPIHNKLAYSQPPTSGRASGNKIQPKLSTESLGINDDGESVLTTKLQIPVSRNVYYNNTDPNRVQKRVTLEEVEAINKRLSPLPPRKSPQPLSKSDSWHRITDSPRVLQKAKSSHSLAIPKQFEAGIAKDEVEVKKKTVAAYFAPSNTKEVITRKRTSAKISTQTKGSSLCRSRTMPDVADLFEDPLDIDTEFENIFRATIAK